MIKKYYFLDDVPLENPADNDGTVNDDCDFLDDEPVVKLKKKVKLTVKQINLDDDCDFIDEIPVKIKKSKSKKLKIKKSKKKKKVVEEECDFID